MDKRNRITPILKDHEYCIIENVALLIDNGYTCYLEHEFLLECNSRKRLVVDIYAKKAEEELIIEVGALSNIHGNRLEVLKRLIPQAKVIHITQWKNYLTSYDWEKVNRKDILVDIQKMGESLK